MINWSYERSVVFSIIIHHASLSELAFCQRIPRFVFDTRRNNNSRKGSVNTCLIFVAKNLRTNSFKGNDLDWSSFWVDKWLFTVDHAKSCYQWNVIRLFHRHLLKCFNDECVLFSLNIDFNLAEGFQAYWVAFFSLTK